MKAIHILDELSEKLEGRRYENYIAAKCVFHDDSSASMLVNADFYHCLACNAHGKSIDLLHKNIPQRKIKFSSLPWHRWLRNRDIQDLAEDAHQTLIDFPQQAHYLKERQIHRVINALQLGWIDGVYTFPIFDQNHKIIGLVARNDPERVEATGDRYFTPPEQAGTLYVPRWKHVLEANPIYVVYGIIDAIAMELCGLPTVTWSVGKNLPAEALADFRKRIIVIPDLGESKAGSKLVGDLDWRGKLLNLDYPDGCKDPADIFKRYGKSALTELVL